MTLIVSAKYILGMSTIQPHQNVFTSVNSIQNMPSIDAYLVHPWLSRLRIWHPKIRPPYTHASQPSADYGARHRSVPGELNKPMTYHHLDELRAWKHNIYIHLATVPSTFYSVGTYGGEERTSGSYTKKAKTMKPSNFRRYSLGGRIHLHRTPGSLSEQILLYHIKLPRVRSGRPSSVG